MRKWFGVAVLAFGLAIAGGMRAQAEEPKAAAAGKGERAKAFIAAFDKGDAKAVAAFWAPEATYIDQVGREVKGRDAIEKMYAKLFAEQKGGKLTVNVKSARLLTPDVAVEDGTTEVAPADGGPGTVAAFSAVLVKKDGEWYFESVRDSIARPPTNADRFDGLEWLIGEWVGEAEKGESATATYDWAENQNFIVSSFATTLNGVPVVGGTQWIGWDAVDKKIRSWSFASGGGIGEGTWTQKGDTWSIATTAKSADGKKIAVTNVLTKVDADHATWQATGLTVDGKEMPEGPVVKLKRVKQ